MSFTKDGRNSSGVIMYDLRQGFHKPVMEHTYTVKDESGMAEELFAHTHYSEHSMLLGGSEGTISLLDTRSSKGEQIHLVSDPYCRAVDRIEYNPYSGAFVVSGVLE